METKYFWHYTVVVLYLPSGFLLELVSVIFLKGCSPETAHYSILATHAIHIKYHRLEKAVFFFALPLLQQRNCAAWSEMDLMALNSVYNTRLWFIGLFESEHRAISRG